LESGEIGIANREKYFVSFENRVGMEVFLRYLPFVLATLKGTQKSSGDSLLIV
jgi:hypothetical protein